MPDFVSLRTPAQFRRVLSEGERRRSGGVVVARLRGPDGPPRVGLVVSKGAGKAVTRNRIRRRLRESARAVELRPGTDYVIIGNSQVAEVEWPRLVAWLTRAIGEEE